MIRFKKVVASAFADLGFDIDIGPMFQTPEEAAQDELVERLGADGWSQARHSLKALREAV